MRFLAIASLIGIPIQADAQHLSGTLRADFAIQWECDVSARAQVEARFEALLSTRGFTSVNVGRLHGNQGTPPNVLYIAGTNQREQRLDFISLNTSGTWYASVFRGAPPTQRDDEMEKQLHDVLSLVPACKVVSFNRGENGIEAKPLHDADLARIRSLVQQGDAMKPGHR